MQPNSGKQRNGFWSISTVVVLIMAWLFFAVFSDLFLTSSLRANAAGDRAMSCLFLTMFFVPPVLMTIFLIRCFRKIRPLKLGKILAWVFRAFYISIIFVLCDCNWWARHGGTIFSRRDWLTHGGVGYIGFGYHVDFLYGSGGRHYGPAIWFW